MRKRNESSDNVRCARRITVRFSKHTRTAWISEKILSFSWIQGQWMNNIRRCAHILTVTYWMGELYEMACISPTKNQFSWQHWQMNLWPLLCSNDSEKSIVSNAIRMVQHILIHMHARIWPYQGRRYQNHYHRTTKTVRTTTAIGTGPDNQRASNWLASHEDEWENVELAPLAAEMIIQAPISRRS